MQVTSILSFSEAQVTSILSFTVAVTVAGTVADTVAALFQREDYCSNWKFTIQTGFLLLLVINRFSQELRTHLLNIL